MKHSLVLFLFAVACLSNASAGDTIFAFCDQDSCSVDIETDWKIVDCNPTATLRHRSLSVTYSGLTRDDYWRKLTWELTAAKDQRGHKLKLKRITQVCIWPEQSGSYAIYTCASVKKER